MEPVQSESIIDVVGNPNFTPLLVVNIDALLPEDPEYCPPLTIQVFEQKSFGRPSLYGSAIVPTVGVFLCDLDEELTEGEKEKTLEKWSKAVHGEDEEGDKDCN